MTEKHSVGWTRDGAEIALNGLEDYTDQTRQALEDAFKQVAELEADKAALEQRVERLKTYAQKLEGHHTAYEAMEWRGALGLDDELASWLIPKEHHALMASQEEEA